MFHRFLFSETRQSLWREVSGFPRSPIQAKLAFKAALAALIAILLAMWLQTDHYYWAGITAIVVTRPNIGETFLKGLNRLGGTLAGGLLAVAIMSLWGSDRLTMILVIFSLSAGTIWVSAHRGRDNYGSVMTGFTAVVTVLGFLTQPEAIYAGAYYRVMEIGLGIVVAFFVNGLLFPVSSAPSLRSGLQHALIRIRKMMGVAVWGYLGNRAEPPRLESGVKELGKILAACGDALFHTRLEQSLAPAQRQDYAMLLSYAAGCREALVEVARLPAIGGSAYPRLYRGEIAQVMRTFAGMLGALSARLGAAKTPAADQEPMEAFHRAVTALRERYEQVRRTPQQQQQPLVAILAFNQFLGICTRLAETLAAEVGPAPKAVREALVDRTIRRQALAGGIAMVVVPGLWMWYDLPSITEIAVSALIVLQVDDVETFRKGVLRIVGCILGGTVGLVLLGASPMGAFPVWIVCFFVFTFFFCYINFGDVRCSYIGLQGALALIMSLVQGNGPGLSLQPPVMRLAAITVAIVVMNMVISLLGVEQPRQRLENIFGQLRRLAAAMLATLARQAEGEDVDDLGLLARFQELGRAVDKTIALLARMEATPSPELEARQRSQRFFRTLFWALRTVFRVMANLKDVPAEIPGLLRRMAVAMADPGAHAQDVAICRQTLLTAMERARGAAAEGLPRSPTEKMHVAALYVGMYALLCVIDWQDVVATSSSPGGTGVGPAGSLPGKDKHSSI